MKSLLHASAEDLGESWASRLRAAGIDVAFVSDPGALQEDGDIFIWATPCTGPPTAEVMPDAIRRIRERIPGRIPLVVAGGPAEEIPDCWLDAGALDILTARMQTADLSARLHRVLGWHCHASVERARLAAEWRQRLELSRQTQKSLAFGLAHDFNNLLSVIQGNVDLSLMSPSLSGEIKYNLDQISQAALRAAGLARQVLDLSRADQRSTAGVNLNQAVLALRGVIRDSAGGCSIELDLEETIPPVRAIMSALVEGIAILVSALSERAEERSAISFSTSSRANSMVVLAIRSTPSTDSAPVTLEPGGGLELCCDLLQESGAVLSLPEHGVAEIAVQACAVQTAPSTPAPGLAGKREPTTVLLIDDEDAVRNATHRLLRQDGYTVLEAASGEEGLELFKSIGGMLDAVVLDLNMPGMEGGEVLHKMRDLRPGVRVVIWSGYPEDLARQQMNGFTDVAFIEKPAQLADFPGMLRRVLQEM